MLLLLFQMLTSVNQSPVFMANVTTDSMVTSVGVKETGLVSTVTVSYSQQGHCKSYKQLIVFVYQCNYLWI